MNSYISNSKYKERLQALIFTAILLLLLFCLKSLLNTIALTKDSADNQGKVTNQGVKLAGIMSHKLDAQIAVFGSSVAWIHFNPVTIENETNKTAFNFGFDGITLQQYNGVLKEFLSYSKAEVIVLAGTYNEFSYRDKVYEFDFYKPYIENKHILSSLVEIDPNILDYQRLKYVPFYEFVYYHKEYYNTILGKTEVDKQAHKEQYLITDLKGFHPVNSSWFQEEWMRHGEISVRKPITVEISDKALKNYREILPLINKRGIKVVLVLPPIYIEGQEGISNLEEVRNTFKALAGRNNYFFDFTKHEICTNKDLFYNMIHLNSRGAEIFSKEFSKQLLDLNIIQK